MNVIFVVGFMGAALIAFGNGLEVIQSLWFSFIL